MISLNAITNGRLIRGLVRTFGMKISGSPAPTLAPEISPGYDVNNWADPTQPFLALTRLQSIWLNVAPSAGNFAVFQLRNPVNSGSLVVVEQLTVLASIQAGLILTTANLGSVVSTALNDFRWFRPGLTQQGAAIASVEQNVAPLGPTAYVLYGNVNAAKCRFVIPPGAALYVQGQSLAVANGCVFVWREIPTGAEELSNG